MEIESMERSGEAFRESPCFLGSFDWMHFLPLPSPKRPRHPLDISLGPSHFHPSVTRLPMIIRVLPGRAGDGSSSQRLSITNSRRRNREEEIAREIQIVYPLKRC